MPTVDANNSYWVQKLYRFKDGDRLFPCCHRTMEDCVEGRHPASPDLVTIELGQVRVSDPVSIGALALITSKYSSCEELLIAQPAIGKNDEAPPLFYRCHIDWQEPAGSFLENIGEEIRESRLHVPYLFDGVAKVVELDRDSVFRISVYGPEGPSLNVSVAEKGIAIKIQVRGAGVQIEMSYDSGFFTRQWAEQFLSHYGRAILFLAGYPDEKLAEFAPLSNEEMRCVAAAFNDTGKGYSEEATLHGLVEQCADRHADSIAVLFEDQSITYQQLEQSANRLANFLANRMGVRPGDQVGLMMRRSEKLVIALLGILKVGAAYVPINPSHPWHTVRYVIEQSAVNVLMVDSESVQEAATFPGEIFIVDLELDQLEEPYHRPAGTRDADLSAYVIFTSGSTGNPKGVAVPHRAIVNTILWRNEFYRFDRADINLQMPSYAFDSSVVDIFCVLSSGGCLVLPQEDLRLDARYLKEMVLNHRVSRLILTPSYYRILMRELGGQSALRSITVAGEATTPEIVQEHASRLPEAALYNEYGPTENAVCSSCCILKAGDPIVPIGRPISNVQVFILDNRLRLAPPGVPGEIYLGGAGLAQGYLGQGSLTAERFVPNCIAPSSSTRLYRTGDWGYWMPAGEIGFLGRVDNQVKVRGFRIELDEVESRLSSCPEVKAAAVVCKEDSGERYLAAYVVPRGILTETDIRQYLRERLPHYMIPEAINLVGELPLTLNGKVDRNQLRTMKERATAAAVDQPETEMEAALASICASLLQRARPGSNDNLFDHGMNSLKVMEMISIIRSELRLDVSLLDVYVFPTIKGLSNRIGDGRWKNENEKTYTI